MKFDIRYYRKEEYIVLILDKHIYFNYNYDGLNLKELRKELLLSKYIQYMNYTEYTRISIIR